MEAGKVKNMVVLRNLPSNIVEEAFIIVKNNKQAKKLEMVEKAKKANEGRIKTEEKDYILKEAEMLVNDYLKEVEGKKNLKFLNNSKNKKYERLKKYAWISSIIIFIETITVFIK
jgi:predicted transcriptional regulator